jgi:hypothetical protein
MSVIAGWQSGAVSSAIESIPLLLSKEVQSESSFRSSAESNSINKFSFFCSCLYFVLAWFLISRDIKSELSIAENSKRVRKLIRRDYAKMVF